MNSRKLATVVIFALVLFIPLNAAATESQCRESCESQRLACIEDCKSNNKSLLCQSECSKAGTSCANQCKKSPGNQAAAKPQYEPTENYTTKKNEPNTGNLSTQGYFNNGNRRQSDHLRRYQYEKWQECFEK